MGDAKIGLVGSQVQAALAAMATSEFFVAAPRLHALLRFLVETTLADPSLKITQRFVAERFLARGVEFDPTIDPVVRVAVSRLRVALERYDAAGLNTFLKFEIPKGGIALLFTISVPRLWVAGSSRCCGSPLQ